MSLKDAIRIADAERKQSENNETANVASNQAVNVASNQAVNVASNKTANVASNQAVKQGGTEAPSEVELAGLTVRVPKRYRVHWLIGAKKQGTSLTAAITEAMNARFGEPNDED